MGRHRRAQSQPLTPTADHLAQAVDDDQPPQHYGTCEVYGFNRAPSPEDKHCLLRLYAGTFGDLVHGCFRDLRAPQGLIKKLNVSPKTIHDWRIRGVLVDEIKTAFYKLPEDSRGLYFPWFLQNQHVIALAGRPLSEEEKREKSSAVWRRGWVAIGGRERDSLQEIQAALVRRPLEVVRCYALYVFLLSARLPSSNFDLWIDFGFASCTSEEEEGVLCEHYRRLIAICTFDEFCNAHLNHRLLDLFHSKDLQVGSNPHLGRLLSGEFIGLKKSVWTLKNYALYEPISDQQRNAITPIILDYGFINCQNQEDWKLLRKTYRDFFTIHRGDPLALYEAYVDGNVYDFLSISMPGLSSRHRQLLEWQFHSTILQILNAPGFWYFIRRVPLFILLVVGALVMSWM